jgi:hypothetical protein
MIGASICALGVSAEPPEPGCPQASESLIPIVVFVVIVGVGAALT